MVKVTCSTVEGETVPVVGYLKALGMMIQLGRQSLRRTSGANIRKGRLWRLCVQGTGAWGEKSRVAAGHVSSGSSG